MEIKSHKDLIVWQKAMDLAVVIYRKTEVFPKSEIYGLTSQIRRSAVSIPSNIAEGYMRGHKSEYIQFLRIAYGSAAELETQILIAKNIDYIREDDFINIDGIIKEILKMLNKLIGVL